MQRSPSQHPFLTSGNPEQGEGSRCYSQTRENWLPSWFSIRLPPPVGVPATSKTRDPHAEVCLPLTQQFPKGVLQSLCFLHSGRGSVARFQPMPGHTTPPISSEGRGKQLSSHACYSAPEGHFHRVPQLAWITSKNFIMPQVFLPAT
jgi:hypothetical protein